MGQQPLRFLLASDTSGHTAGYHVVLQGLRDAGIEVVALGYAEPKAVADAAVQEDADVIGYRIMDRDAVTLMSMLRSALEERGVGDIPIVFGGIIRKDVIPTLKEMGVKSVFGPGSRIPDIVDFVVGQKV